MEEHELHLALDSLGIREANWRSVLLLPLVQVAWADHAIQSGERREIVEIAQMLGVDPELRDRWLAKRPSDEQLALARHLIVTLAHRQRGLGADLPPAVLDTLESLCVRVAESAGGLFGIAFSVSPEEQAAINAISDDLHAASASFLDQLPTPETGSFQEL